MAKRNNDGTSVTKARKSKAKDEENDLDETETGGEAESLDDLDDEAETEDAGDDAEDAGDADESDESDDAEDADEDEAPTGKIVSGSTSKPGKGKAKASAEEEAEEGGEDELPYAPTFEVFEVPVGDLTPNKVRVPAESKVQEMARSIKNIGLLSPILIGQDYVVIAGNTRLAAFQKLGRKSIPCRFVCDKKTGEPIDGKDAAMQAISENVIRTEMTPLEKARAYKVCVEKSFKGNAAEFAKSIGVTAASVSQILALAENASKDLKGALEEGKITQAAASAIIARSGGDSKRMNALLADLLKASEGKTIGTSDVDKAAPSGKSRKTRSAGKKRGPKPVMAQLDPAVLKTDDTGISGSVRINRETKKFTVRLVIEVENEKETFARFALIKSMQAAVARLNEKAVLAELESQRQTLVDA